MASNTQNVKVGVCQVFYDGNDLGYTKGGVEVEVSSETYRSEVDQFGKTAISEIVMSRSVKVKVPLAETTLDNLVRIMPGATLVQVGGAKATGTITVGTNPTNATTVIVNGVTFTFKTTAVTADEVTIGGTAANTATNLAAKLNASLSGAVGSATYTVATSVVTATYDEFGIAGNAFTLGAGTSGVTVSGAVLAGGVTPTTQRVNVTDATGTNLLTIAKELRLHPQEKASNDQSEDFVIPLAATPGGMQFAYRLEEERVFSCEFMAYPNPTDRKLFYVGS
jgi:hypothetical protein